MNRYLTLIVDMGELLLAYGAEAARVEDTITRLCRAYGFTRTEVFTITSTIIVTAWPEEDEEPMTQTRRIRVRDTNLGKVEQLNALSRAICKRPIERIEFQNRLHAIREQNDFSRTLRLAMYMMVSASLSVFFGGSLWDGLAAAVSGTVLYGMLCGSMVLKMSSIIQSMICSAVTAAAVLILVRAGIGMRPDKIMIGNIMLVIPGIQLTNSLRDMINGDTISGLLNMSEAVLKAAAVAMGFALVLLIGG